MKILYYSANFQLKSSDPSGYGTHIREMIFGFEANGHNVLQVILGDKELALSNAFPMKRIFLHLFKKFIPRYFIESIKDYFLLKKDFLAQEMLEHHVKSFSPDVIYERASRLQVSGVRVARKYQIRHILEMNAPLVEEHRKFFGNSLFFKRGTKRELETLHTSSKVVFVSTALKDYFMSQSHLKESAVAVLPNAINPEKFVPSLDKIMEFKSKYDLHSKTVIGFVGSVFPWHGVDLLVEAFIEIAKSRKDLSLLLVGDGAVMPRIIKNAHKSVVASQIIFTGNLPHEEVPSIVECMDICVMAKSNWYGSPVKIFEYGLLGKAVIAPDVAPVREVMKDGVDGILVAPEKMALQKALEDLVDQKMKRVEMGKNLKTRILETHTWKRNAERALLI